MLGRDHKKPVHHMPGWRTHLFFCVAFIIQTTGENRETMMVKRPGKTKKDLQGNRPLLEKRLAQILIAYHQFPMIYLTAIWGLSCPGFILSL